MAVAGVAPLIEHQPAGRRVVGPIRVGAHAWVASRVPSWGMCKRQPHPDVFPSLSLKVNKVFLK